jgi:hypothetical protein
VADSQAEPRNRGLNSSGTFAFGEVNRREGLRKVLGRNSAALVAWLSQVKLADTAARFARHLVAT